MTIDNEAAAQRLARALCSDVALYNRAKLAGGGDLRSALAAPLDEARALFRERVAAELHPVFERELDAFDFSVAVPRPLNPAVAALFAALVLAVAGYALLGR